MSSTGGVCPVPLYGDRPESFGWMRRPELDTPTSQIWELPDGQLYAHEKAGPALQLVPIPEWLIHRQP